VSDGDGPNVSNVNGTYKVTRMPGKNKNNLSDMRTVLIILK